MRKNNSYLTALLMGALTLGGTAPTVQGHNAATLQEQRAFEVSQKRTPLGNLLPGRGKHFFKSIPQKHKKHTNRLKSAHLAKVKRRKNKNRR